MKVITRGLAALGLFVLLMLIVGIFAPHESKRDPEKTAYSAINFDLPLQTTAGTLVCPLGAAFDNREGRGLQAAMKSRIELFGRREDAEKAGCSEWREDLKIQITEESRARAKQWQTTHDCGMLEFSEGMIYSCDLVNVPGVVATFDRSRYLPPQTKEGIYACMEDKHGGQKPGLMYLAAISCTDGSAVSKKIVDSYIASHTTPKLVVEMHDDVHRSVKGEVLMPLQTKDGIYACLDGLHDPQATKSESAFLYCSNGSEASDAIVNSWLASPLSRESIAEIRTSAAQPTQPDFSKPSTNEVALPLQTKDGIYACLDEHLYANTGILTPDAVSCVDNSPASVEILKAYIASHTPSPLSGR